MTENEKIELFDKWYDENYDEWAEGEEGIALREELEQAFKSGIAELEKENAELKKKNLDTQDAVTMQMYTNKANKEIADKQLTKAKEIIKTCLGFMQAFGYSPSIDKLVTEAEQFIKENEK